MVIVILTMVKIVIIARNLNVFGYIGSRNLDPICNIITV